MKITKYDLNSVISILYKGHGMPYMFLNSAIKGHPELIIFSTKIRYIYGLLFIFIKPTRLRSVALSYDKL